MGYKLMSLPEDDLLDRSGLPALDPDGREQEWLEKTKALWRELNKIRPPEIRRMMGALLAGDPPHTEVPKLGLDGPSNRKIQLWPDAESKFLHFERRHNWMQLLGHPDTHIQMFPDASFHRPLEIAKACLFGQAHPDEDITIAKYESGIALIGLTQEELERLIDMVIIMEK